MSVSLRRSRFAVFPVLAAVLTALFTVTPAHAASGTITGLADKCVDVAGASTANGTAVQLYDCNGTGAQIWSNSGDGALRALGKCLDVADRSTADGAAVQLWDCSGGANQQWVVSAARDIVNPAANKCLDVRDNSSANGSRLQIWTCAGTANQKWNAPASGGGGTPSGFVVTEAQFNQMFPNRNSFYTYSGLVAALSAYPGFATTGSDTVKKQEAAAFLANVNHETGGLVHIVEQNTANYPTYCDWNQPYGCPAGQAAYYGRGPIQLSWNFNYRGRGRRVGARPAQQPLAGAERLRRGLEDRPLVLEHPVRPRHHDSAQRHGQPGRLRPDDPQHQRLPGVRRPQPGPGAEPRRRLQPVHVDPRGRPRRQPLLLNRETSCPS